MEVPMTTFWFKPKSMGYGAYPVTWQGWALIAAFVAADLTLAYATLGPAVLDGRPPETASLLLFLTGTAALTVAFLVVCRQRTEGTWRWRWPENKP
jgi:hypothetical protein